MAPTNIISCFNLEAQKLSGSLLLKSIEVSMFKYCIANIENAVYSYFYEQMDPGKARIIC